MKVLVTGGAGFIGSTTCSALIDAGHTPVILDSFVTGRREYVKGRIFYEGDIADSGLMAKILKENPDIEACIHFAARIVVEESVAEPLLYYEENVSKSIALFANLRDAGIKKVIFSSSAAVYGTAEVAVTESTPLTPTSPYARTKMMMEMALEDFANAGYFKGIALRYFNLIGADPKMRTGPFLPDPSHILGRLVDTAMGKTPQFTIFGDDWDTRDGTTVRDYIHVWDLALAHVAALEHFDRVAAEQYNVINLSTGEGTTVKEFVDAFINVWGEIPIVIGARRKGDIVGAYAKSERSAKLLGWKTQFSIEQGIKDALHWVESVRDSVLQL
ncbi:MAG: UDP-glucose 4-epimerase GalE [Defluviitaleaceae bacterium]|nr:UDP-glucose 4-epimerase GalE [Defluviitaleaceae bacterium]